MTRLEVKKSLRYRDLKLATFWVSQTLRWPEKGKLHLFMLFCNLVARARDPLWEESWGSGKKPKRMHGIHCIPLLSDPVH